MAPSSYVFEKNRKNMHCSKIDVLKLLLKKYIDHLFDKVFKNCSELTITMGT